MEIDRRGTAYIIPPELWNLIINAEDTIEAASDRDIIRKTSTPVDNSDPEYTTTDPRVRLVGITASVNCANTVGNRTIKLTVTRVGETALPGAGLIMETATIALTQNQSGMIILGDGPNHKTNVAGTVANVANENILPIVVETGCMITCMLAGAGVDAGDRCGLEVYLEKVGEV